MMAEGPFTLPRLRALIRGAGGALRVTRRGLWYSGCARLNVLREGIGHGALDFSLGVDVQPCQFGEVACEGAQALVEGGDASGRHGAQGDSKGVLKREADRPPG